MNKKLMLYLLVIPVFIYLTGCSNGETDSRSLEEIHKKEGIPVETEIVKYKKFKSNITFFAAVSGAKQSMAGAPIDGKIDKILVKVGDRVKKDQVIITFPEDSPATKYHQARAAFENIRTAYSRIENLYKAGGVSRQERDNMKAQYEAMKADWDAVKQSVKVRAPISGTITALFVSETDNVRQKDLIAIVSQPGSLKAVIWVAEQDIQYVKPGNTARAEWMGNKVEGKVTHVDTAMNMLKKSFRTLVEFDDPEAKIHPGVTVKITVAKYENPNALVVDNNHISESEGKTYLFILDGDQALRRNVIIGARNEFEVEIMDGLSPGDRLITSGNHVLSHQCKVRPVDGSSTSK